ncbi:MAG: pyridoxal-phosphate dependent enzyme [Saprospiraceae bacterium]|nr:pyridoxal-phosphate dependent enzyme [Saprospiraceae bacterium]
MDIKEIEAAAARIASYLYMTPLVYNSILSNQLKSQVYLKLENQQVSGSFKARGAYNKILSYPESERKDRFFVAASTGNHAAAFCSALTNLKLKGKVFLPENVSTSKLEYIKATGVPFELFGKNSLHTEIYCRKVAEENNFVLVHPYNDPEIVAGQGTVAREMLKQQPELDIIIAPVGGGGLISGMGIYLKNKHPSIKLIGCQPVNSPEMVRSIESQHIIEEDISLPTLSDGTAGGMEKGSITFPLCQKYVDDWALLEEGEIAEEIYNMIKTDQLMIEGAAALPLAFLRQNTKKMQGKKIGLVITGKRISLEKLKSLFLNRASSDL